MKKNILFHCYIKNINELNESLCFGLKCLQNYMSVFDGKKVITITLDQPELFDHQKFSEKIELINLFDEVIVMKNNSHNRESESLIEMLESVKSIKNSMTFYAHTKGSTWSLDSCLKNWILSMYFFNLEQSRIDKVEENFISGYTTSGILKKDCRWNINGLSGEWHYSGAFFWINNEELFKYNWQTLVKGRMSLEAYLGQRIPTEKAACNFVCRNYNFLIDDLLWESEIRTPLIGNEEFKKYKEIFDL